jgi:hypothetical protein
MDQVRKFHRRVRMLATKNRTLEEAYDFAEKFFKQTAGKRMYKSYNSYRSSYHYLFHNGLLR